MIDEIPARIGRPPEPVPEHKARELLEHIAQGGTLARWCKQANVSPSTVRKWGKKDSEFGDAMRDARATAVQQMEADTLRIADECEPADVAVARLRCDVRSWAVARGRRNHISPRHTPLFRHTPLSPHIPSLPLFSVSPLLNRPPPSPRPLLFVGKGYLLLIYFYPLTRVRVMSF